MSDPKKHIWILGPPAVGKRTVARLVCQRSGFPLLDNAKTVDIAASIHRMGTTAYRKLRDDLRIRIYKSATSDDCLHGLVSTNVLRAPENWEFFSRCSTLMTAGAWETMFVILTASDESLLRRVVNEDRKDKVSFTSSDALKEWLDKNQNREHGAPQNALAIDTTTTRPASVAEMICEWAKL